MPSSFLPTTRDTRNIGEVTQVFMILPTSEICLNSIHLK